jgi:hypothetical protein
MSDATTHPPITQLLAEVSTAVGAVKKTERSTHGGFSFRGIDAVMTAVGPELAKRSITTTVQVLQRDTSTRATNSGGAMNVTHLLVRYTWHGPAGDSCSSEVWGEGADSGDKSTSKALAMAMKYAVLQSLCLPTDDPDPDHDVHAAAPFRLPDLDRTLARIEAGDAAALDKAEAWLADLDPQLVPDDYATAVREHLALRRTELAAPDTTGQEDPA